MVGCANTERPERQAASSAAAVRMCNMQPKAGRLIARENTLAADSQGCVDNGRKLHARWVAQFKLSLYKPLLLLWQPRQGCLCSCGAMLSHVPGCCNA